MSTDYTMASSLYMCNKCFALHKIDFVITTFSNYDSGKPARLNSLDPVYCDVCNNKGKFTRVDFRIATAISELNKKGYFTSQHGQGFGTTGATKFRPPFIAFKSIARKLFGSLPDGWDYDKDENTTFIRARIAGGWTDDKQKEAIRALTEWVKKLPDINP